MSDKVTIRRLPTGVPGLDAVLGGGAPEFSFNVIGGAPGAGKTTLAQPIMSSKASSKGLAVVKVRGSAHEKDLRLFEITADGIVVGERIGHYQGLLTGSPQLISAGPG